MKHGDALAAPGPQATVTDGPPISEQGPVSTDVTSKSLAPVVDPGTTQEVDALPVASAVTAASLPPVGSQAPGATTAKGPAYRPRLPPARWVPIGGLLGLLVLGAGLFLLDSSGEAAPGEQIELLISSNPPGAMVTFDGRPLASRTPFSIDEVATDRSHLVIIDLPGHVRWTQRLKVTPGGQNKVHAILQAVAP